MDICQPARATYLDTLLVQLKSISESGWALNWVTGYENWDDCLEAYFYQLQQTTKDCVIQLISSLRSSSAKKEKKRGQKHQRKCNIHLYFLQPARGVRLISPDNLFPGHGPRFPSHSKKSEATGLRESRPSGFGDSASHLSYQNRNVNPSSTKARHSIFSGIVLVPLVGWRRSSYWCPIWLYGRLFTLIEPRPTWILEASTNEETGCRRMSK